MAWPTSSCAGSADAPTIGILHFALRRPAGPGARARPRIGRVSDSETPAAARRSAATRRQRPPLARLRRPLRALLAALRDGRHRVGARQLARLGRHLRGDPEPRRRRSLLGAFALPVGALAAAPAARLGADGRAPCCSARSSSSSPGSSLDFVVAWGFFGADHATATFQQRVLWRAMWGVFAYSALVFGFGSALHARRAQRVAIAAARAEAALVRAELAKISGKLNPHFLFNTLNSLLILTRKDPAAAEQALLRFSRMMRYVLDTTRSATDRVPLQRRARVRARLPRARVAAPGRAPEGRLADRSGHARRRRSRR